MSSYKYPTSAPGVDAKYPGTATARLSAVLERVSGLSEVDDLSQDWTAVRSKLLWAGGLVEDPSTGHAFNDSNHCDLTTMVSGLTHMDHFVLVDLRPW